MSRPQFFTPTLDQVKEARNHYRGFCRACGAECDGVEPDATNYECESCGESEVYGAEEFLMNGWVAA